MHVKIIDPKILSYNSGKSTRLLKMLKTFPTESVQKRTSRFIKYPVHSRLEDQKFWLKSRLHSYQIIHPYTYTVLIHCTNDYGIPKIMKMNNLGVVLLAFLFSGSNCKPVKRKPGKQIHRRSTYGQCRKMVIVHCEFQKKTFSSKNRLDVYEKCLLDGFTHYCG